MRNQNNGRGRSNRVVRGSIQDRDERAPAPTPDRGEFGDLHDEYRGGNQNQAEIEALKDELDDKTILVRVVGWSLLLIGSLLIA